MGMIRFARLENSGRLQRLLRALSDGKWHSTREARSGANIEGFTAAITELRRNGIPVASRCRPKSGRIWEYKLGGKHD